nr:hypothetical protein [Tanacetum cinerariifolium]
MVSNVNVLGPRVLDIIAAESNGTAIVTIQGNLIEDKAVVYQLVLLTNMLKLVTFLFDLYDHRSNQSPIDDSLYDFAPHSPEYVPDPIEPEDHVPTHIPEHPEDLVPAEDEAHIEAYIPEVASAPTPPLPPFFLSSCIRPPHTRAAMAQMRAAVPSTYHSLLLSGTPPLLPIPLPAPSTSRRAKIPEADTPPQKRLLLTVPRPGCEVGESSAAARQPGPTMARSVDCSFVDTMETRFRNTERRMMTALEIVNMRVSYQVDVRSRESSEFYSRHHDAQKDCTAVRAEIEVFRRERLAYEQESIQTREVLARSEAYSRALEARVAVLETQARHHEWQRQTADDLAVQHIMYTQALEVGARIDTLADTEASIVRNSYDSNGSGPRLAQAVRECTYPDFLKCQPLNFKGTEGVVGLTQWSRSYMVELPCEDCYSESCSGIAMENFEENDDRQVLPRGEIKKLKTEMWE